VGRRTEKLMERFVGPYKVKSIVLTNVIELELPSIVKIHPVVDVSRVRRYTGQVVMVLSFRCITLTRIALYVRANKKNLLEFSLDCVHYLYMSDCLSLFTDAYILSN